VLPADIDQDYARRQNPSWCMSCQILSVRMQSKLCWHLESCNQSGAAQMLCISIYLKEIIKASICGFLKSSYVIVIILSIKAIVKVVAMLLTIFREVHFFPECKINVRMEISE